METSAKRKRKWAIVAALIAVVIAVVVGFLLANHGDNSASSIRDANGVSQADLDEQAQKSRIWISVANTIYCDPNSDTCYATDKNGSAITVLDNREDNSRDLTYSMALEDGTVIYESDLIKPGEGIESPKLSKHLDKGTYNVTVTAQGHDVDSHEAVGDTVSAQVTLVVK